MSWLPDEPTRRGLSTVAELLNELNFRFTTQRDNCTTSILLFIHTVIKDVDMVAHQLQTDNLHLCNESFFSNMTPNV